jgi:hypothetical protein
VTTRLFTRATIGYRFPMITTLCLALPVQQKAMENCVELLVVKLLHATKDGALKVMHSCSAWFGSHLLVQPQSWHLKPLFMSLSLQVVNQAHICLTTVVTQFDPLRCLGVSLFCIVVKCCCLTTRNLVLLFFFFVCRRHCK